MHYLLTLLLLLLPSPLWAAITIDGTISFVAGRNGTGYPDLSVSHSSTAPTLALACVAERASSNNMGASTSVPTYGGNTMTLVTGATQTQATRVKTSLYYYVSPPSGSQTVALATVSTNSNRYMMSVMTLAGTATTSIFNTAGTNGGDSGQNLDVDGLASAVGEFAVACGLQSTNAPVFSADATSPVSTEQLDEDMTATDSIGLSHFVYTEDGAATSINMRVDSTVSQYWSMVAVSIRPAVTATTQQQSPVFYP